MCYVLLDIIQRFSVFNCLSYVSLMFHVYYVVIFLIYCSLCLLVYY